MQAPKRAWLIFYIQLAYAVASYFSSEKYACRQRESLLNNLTGFF